MPADGRNGGRAAAGSLWAVTAYFNPVGYRTRRENFRRFRERMTVPLVAVEFAHGGAFELTPDDAEILVQLSDGDVLWQKERLLNIGLGKLPDDCDNVVLVDCDIIVDTPDWAEKIDAALTRVPLVQAFRYVRQLPEDGLPETVDAATLPTRESLIYSFCTGTPLETCLNELPADGIYRMARGFAWAARRSLLDRHRLYDACIIGGGDRAMAYAIFGQFDMAIRHFHMSETERRRYLDWAVPFAEAVGGAFDFIDSDILHLWHGDMRRRGSSTRQAALRHFRFDPNSDIAVADGGAWRWNTDKPDMHDFMQSYFASRREDG